MGEAKRRAEAAAARPIFWARCPICGNDWPWPSKALYPRPETFDVCQVCLWADIARVIRECPERFRLLPSARVMQGLPQITEVESSLTGGAS